MAKTQIPLGTRDQLEILYSYPNIPGSEESLEDTILHWFGMTLVRDGLQTKMASVRVEGSNYILELDGPTEEQNQAYAERLPEILKIGWKAWEDVVPNLKEIGKWDPDHTDQWRFFLTLGVGIVDYRTLQFFHYPPIRLLNPLRDSMKDPVTYRCRDLLIANGVQQDGTRRYETRINSTPIAAPDDQGTSDSPNADPIWGGLIPIAHFRDFERAMVKTLLQPHPTCEGYTIPMIIYGSDPRQRFGGMWLSNNKAMLVEILPGLKTPILGSNHPYSFYWHAQDGGKGKGVVGSGHIVPEMCAKSVQIMKADLAVVRWQVRMADDPSLDPWSVQTEAKQYWDAPEQQAMVCALVKRQGSLFYMDPDGNDFHFNLSLQEAMELCAKDDNNPCANCI